ncbi:Calx-beta domain-containing protein [Roseofilum reptotaenium CS-1145]|uniref:LTD domain-containing protein n=1 Tax=Roseofilum reptotaenium AO1-A TaxID=1925591 RepID=A0A1L9QT64_9CYAN|nr:Calx-beta domain-containing protein [Roseofilum reptotaenium]MDB9519100.1 Calx-beta domain-containing protein [Roseofilum reptotaenium CS-1145]OJJ25853.1 hypothetical protein BI308_08945 [Roseofilum reptotaenium AO1-A]
MSLIDNITAQWTATTPFGNNNHYLNNNFSAAGNPLAGAIDGGPVEYNASNGTVVDRYNTFGDGAKSALELGSYIFFTGDDAQGIRRIDNDWTLPLTSYQATTEQTESITTDGTYIYGNDDVNRDRIIKWSVTSNPTDFSLTQQWAQDVGTGGRFRGISYFDHSAAAGDEYIYASDGGGDGGFAERIWAFNADSGTHTAVNFGGTDITVPGTSPGTSSPDRVYQAIVHEYDGRKTLIAVTLNAVHVWDMDSPTTVTAATPTETYTLGTGSNQLLNNSSTALGGDFYGAGARNDQLFLLHGTQVSAYQLAQIPDIALSSPTFAASNVLPGTTNHPLYQLDLAVTTANTQLTGATFTTGGSYVAADIVPNSFELFYSTDTTFDAGDTSLGTQAVVTSGNTLAFTGLSQTINSGNTGTLFLVADIATGATTGNTINIAASTLSDITFTSGNKTGTPTAGGIQTITSPLVISEIMYDPASSEDNWEWIEVYNSGSSTVDLSGYVLDDNNSIAQGSANIASGSIAAGTSAILFNDDDLDASDFEAAWGTGITFIGVTGWSNIELNNTGETVSLWDSFTSYSSDHIAHANAIETVDYSSAGFPDPTGASIYLTNLTADNTVGSNWGTSTVGGSTPLGTGYLSADAGGNSGNDIGSPGGTLSAVTLSSGTISAANVAQGTTNHPLYQLDLAVTTANAQLTSATFTTAGTYAAADIVANSFELFYSTDTIFGNADDASLGTQAVVTSGNTLAFTGLSQTINSGSTGTLFLVADIASGATAGNTINIAAPNLSDIIFTSASKTGTLSASGDQAFDALPTITSITSTTTDGTFGVGGTVNVTVNFSENVTLAGGNLTLNLDSGGTVILSPFSSSNSASGSYTVGTGENSTDLNSTGLTLAGGATLQDTTANNVTLTIPGGQSLADNKALVIDTTAPTVTVEQAVSQGDPTTNSPINYTVTFSEPVTGFATGDVTLGGTAGATIATVTGSGTTYNVAVSGMTGNGTVIGSLAAGVATDIAGNANTASTSTDNMVTFIANSAPVVDLNGGASGIDYSATFTSGGGQVAIVDSTNLTVTDDGANLTNATVSITNLLDGADEVLSVDTSGTSISFSYNTATGVLNLSGSDTVANYQQVLRKIVYNNTAASPNTTARTIEFVANDGSLNSTTATTTLNIALPPTIEFSAASYTSAENVGTSSAIALTRTGNTTSTSTVQVSLTGGTATGGGTDYTSSSFPLTVTFNAGETSKTIDIPVNDDSIDEPGADETVTFSVASLTNTTIGSQNTTTLNITDNDNTPNLSIADVSVNENAGTATFTVSLDAASAQTITVDYASSDGTAVAGSDYTSASGTLTFAAGETSKDITVNISDDSLDESNETFSVDLSNASNATISDAQGVGTITDNDGQPNLSISDVTVNENAGTATFTVSLDAASAQSITVDYASSDGTAIAGSDYTSASGSLTFAAGETSKAITVNISDDSLDEINETFTVNLTNASNASIADAQGKGTITDNDGQPSLSINDVTVNERAGTLTFAISLDAASAQDITVDYASADGTATAGNDYTSTTGSLTFSAGETRQEITVNLTEDSADETDETFTINLTNATNATISDAEGLGTIMDNDVAVVASPFPSPSPSLVTPPSSPNPQVPASPPSNSPVSLSCPPSNSPVVFPALNLTEITREGTVFADILFGNNQNETFLGSADNDWVIALQGNDNINGENGDDWLIANQGTDVIDGGLGNDWIHGGQGNDGVRGGEGNDVIFGERGNDIVEGNDGNDFLSGNTGNDFLDGGLGDDVVHAGQDNDRLAGGEGNDTLFGDLGDDCIHGNLGNDWLLGNQGDDDLRGQGGHDSLWGGEGNDILLGGVGDDVLFGDRGNDLFVLAIGEGRDRIIDFSAGDRLRLSTGLTYTQLTLAQNGDNTIISSNNQVLAILENVMVNTLNENRFFNVV